MRKLKIGDIIEIKTNIGLVYAQYTHEHVEYGSLIRVFDCRFEERPTCFKSVVTIPVQITTFILLRAALRQKIFEVVENEEVVGDLQKFPVFRSGLANPSTMKIEVLWLWDGEKTERIGDLTEEQKSFPMRGIWNDTLLIARIERGWKVEDEMA